MPDEYQKLNDKEHCEFRKSIKNIDTALFGDANGNKGMEIMVKEMHAFFTNVSGFSKSSEILLKAIILIGAAIGVIFGLIRWLKQ